MNLQYSISTIWLPIIEKEIIVRYIRIPVLVETGIDESVPKINDEYHETTEIAPQAKASFL